MILGIVTAVLFLLECCFGLWKKIAKGKLSPKTLSKLHRTIGILTLAGASLHLVLSHTLGNQRPSLMYLSGILAMLCIALAICLGFRGISKKRLKLHKTLALLAFICLCVHVSSGISSLMKYQKTVRNIEISDVYMQNIPDGVYQGECDVQYIYARVQVTVRDGKMTEIELLEHRNEQGAAAEKITDDILEKQSLDVDAITSATNSGNVIKKAIENALENAG